MPYVAFQDRTGQRYGRLLIAGYVGIKNHSRIWSCQCDCGEFVHVAWKYLQSGQTRSCGCLQRETRAKYPGSNKLAEGESAFNQFFYSYQKSARERGYEFSLSREQFRALTQLNSIAPDSSKILLIHIRQSDGPFSAPCSPRCQCP